MKGTRIPAALSEVRPGLGRAWHRYRSRCDRQEAVAALTDVVRRMPDQPDLPRPARWTLPRVVTAETSATVALFGGQSGAPVVVGRAVRSDRDDGPLRRNDAALRALRADTRLLPLLPLLPAPLALTEHAGWTCAVERAVAGVPARVAARDRRPTERIVSLVAEAAAILHRETASSTLVDDELFDRWVGRPVEAIRRAHPEARGTVALEARLRGELLGRTCTTAWIHGDLWLGNVLLDERAERIQGLVDWDAAVPQGVPLVDLLHLLVATRSSVEHAHLGAVVASVLQGRPWTDTERRVLGEDRSAQAVPQDVAVLLMWLIHVESVLGKSARPPSDHRWFDRNVEPVLSQQPAWPAVSSQTGGPGVGNKGDEGS